METGGSADERPVNLLKNHVPSPVKTDWWADLELIVAPPDPSGALQPRSPVRPAWAREGSEDQRRHETTRPDQSELLASHVSG
jgi:hypothetical protein